MDITPNIDSLAESIAKLAEVEKKRKEAGFDRSVYENEVRRFRDVFLYIHKFVYLLKKKKYERNE